MVPERAIIERVIALVNLRSVLEIHPSLEDAVGRIQAFAAERGSSAT